MAKGHKPGGGISSNKRVEKPVKYGQPAHRKRHEGVSRIGQQVGDHSTEHPGLLRNVERTEGGVIPGVGSVPLGNELAKNVGKGGPGTGRTLYGNIGGKQYGPPEGSPKPQGRPILSSFGPESK